MTDTEGGSAYPTRRTLELVQKERYRILTTPTSVTYGGMPWEEEYVARYVAYIGEPSATISFRNDKRVGTVQLSCDELWEELLKAYTEYWQTGDEAAGDWCSAVLGLLKIEWI